MNEQWTGVKTDDNGEICCASCGELYFNAVSHVDADKWYSYVFECSACGHRITLVADRDPESIKWHDEPMEEI